MTFQLAVTCWSNQNPGLRWARPSLHCQRGENFCCYQYWKLGDKSQQKRHVEKTPIWLVIKKYQPSTRVLPKFLPWIVQLLFSRRLEWSIWHGFKTSWNHGDQSSALMWEQSSAICWQFECGGYIWMYQEVSKCFVIGLHSWKLTAGTWESPLWNGQTSSIRLQFWAPAVGFWGWTWKNNRFQIWDHSRGS